MPVTAHIGLLLLHDLGAHLILTLVLVVVAFAGVGWAVKSLRGALGGLGRPILLVAVLLRALLLPLPPSLSEDVERYLWDGRVVRAGLNPYRLPPDAPELVPLRDPRWSQLPHRDVPTVYPPLAQAAFSIAAALPASLLMWKSLLAMADLGSCLLLLRLARRWRLPAERTLWYAWNPLVTVEVAGMGHVDGLGVAAMLCATVLIGGRVRRLGPAAVLAAGAVLVKLVPILALPAWARQSGRPLIFLLVAGAWVGIGLLPVLVATGGVPPGLVKYAVSWEFNGPLFEPLWRALDRTHFPEAMHSGLDLLKRLTGEHPLVDRLYPLNYPQLWAKLLLSVGLLVSAALAWRLPEVLGSLRRVFGAVILFSATVYPWYLLWVLPWAALSGHRAWIGLSVLLFLSYIPKFLGVSLFPLVFVLIWLPFVALCWSRLRWSMR